MSYYKIVHMILESENMPLRFAPFLCGQENQEEGAQILKIRYLPSKHLQEPFDALAEVSGLRIGKGADSWIFHDLETACRMQVNSDYSEAVLSEELKEHADRWAFLLQLFIECRLLDEGVLTLHSSCIALDGKAYAFSGPSGCGKSTRARMWVLNYGADYISGDRPAIDVKRQIAYGIPWDGKEQIYCNRRAQIAAVFQVRRSSVTRLRRMSKKQVRKFLAGQIVVPMWDSERSMEAMFLLNRLAETFPVYRLFCDRDEQAAAETKRILLEQREKIEKESIDMNLKDGFVLKSMAGEYVLMPIGANIAKFNGTVLLNDVSAFVIRQLEAGPLCREDLIDLILQEYDADKDTVAEDLDELTTRLSDMGVIETE